jgi:transposase
MKKVIPAGKRVYQGGCVAEKYAVMIKQQLAKKNQPFFESPYFPGILFRKTLLHSTIEKEKADSLETVYDYLDRVYRKEQLTPSQLASEFGVGKFLVNRILRSAGVPPLKSWEYLDPHRAATAKRWEDQEKRRKVQEGLKNAWDQNKSSRVAKNHSPEAQALRVASNKRSRSKSVNCSGGRDQSELGVKEQIKKAVLGDDPKAVLTDLLEVKGLGYKAAAVALKNQVSEGTIRRWAKEEGITRLPTTSHEGIRSSQYQRFEFLCAERDRWCGLTERQQAVLNLLVDETGRLRNYQKIAELIGITPAGISYLLNSAVANLSAQDQ